MLNAGTAILTPDHLPGSWNPRPGWRKPRPGDDKRQIAAWSVRTSLVLLYWADRLEGVVCTARGDVVAGLDLALGHRTRSLALDLPEPRRLAEAQAPPEGIPHHLRDRSPAILPLTRRPSPPKL